MPFDASPIESKPDVFSLEGLIAWLEKQNPELAYCYFKTGGCLLYTYLADHRVPVRSVGGDYWRDRDWKEHPFPEAFAKIAAKRPHTFGAALSRARTALGEKG